MYKSKTHTFLDSYWKKKTPRTEGDRIDDAVLCKTNGGNKKTMQSVIPAICDTRCSLSSHHIFIVVSSLLVENVCVISNVTFTRFPSIPLKIIGCGSFVIIILYYQEVRPYILSHFINSYDSFILLMEIQMTANYLGN